MDESLREILTRHWQLVVRYLNPTDDFINTLLMEKVLPASMVEDIKKGQTRQEKNERLIKSLKLRGKVSYRKFLDILMRFGQVFLADLLWEEENSHPTIIDEYDLSCFPSLKLSLTPEEQRLLISVLDSKIKSRLLQTEWRKDSNKRLEILKSRGEEQKARNETTIEEYKEQVRSLKAEISAKNDALSGLVVEMNSLNDDVIRFVRRHQTNPNVTGIKHEDSWQGGALNATPVPPSNAAYIQKSRFKFFDTAVDSVCRQFTVLIGEGVCVNQDDPGKNCLNLEKLLTTSNKVQALVRDMEASIYTHTQERDTVLALLFPNKSEDDLTLVSAVQQFLAQEQKHRCSLLKDIDRLSRRLRGLNNGESKSVLKALRQSAVIGKPSPEVVDYRFLANHLALLSADADHINKKLGWKDCEIHSLTSELKSLKGRFTFGR